MNPWTYTIPRGSEGGGADFDLNTLEYEYVDDFIEENNHPGKMEDGQVSVTYCMHVFTFNVWQLSSSFVNFWSFNQ